MPQPHETIVDCFWRRVELNPDKPAVFTFHNGNASARTWQQIADDVVRGATQLHMLGVQPGDCVVQLSENCYEWLIADLAILASGAIHVPIHSPLPAAAVLQQVESSRAKVCVVSDQAQWSKIETKVKEGSIQALFHKLPPTRSTAEDLKEEFTPFLPDYLPAPALTEAKLRLQQLRQQIQPVAPATLLYTSGTTGEPRGVLLSQRNLYLNATAVIEAFLPRCHDRRLNLLPLSHIFARTCDWYVTIVSGTELGLATSRESVLADCQTFQPTVLNGVPYFFDKVRRTLLEQADNPSADSLKNILGGKVSLCNVGGAALADQLFDFYQERGVALRQGYGLTESSPVVTLSTTDRFLRGSVGNAVPGVEIRIAEDGEILAKSSHVMLGYWNDVVSTKETVRDGWLHTGDLGQIDANGFLHVTGRRKEMLALASGKKVNPTRIEALLTAEPLILQAFVVGEGRNYLTAFLVPNPDVLRKKIKEHWLLIFSAQQALNHKRVRQWFEEAVQRALADVAPWEQVKKFALLGRGFTLESGELTPKLTLRREVIEQNLSAEIEDLYR